MRIDVSPAGYEAASRIFGRELHDGLYATLLSAGTALGGTGAMAGSDPVGVSWATEYDGAAGSVIDTIAQLCSASSTLARMLERSGFNHGVAEWASDPTHAVLRPADTTHYPARTDLSCLESLPSASGGSTSPPHGWGTIAHAVGRIWPNGHPDTLHTAAQAWTDAADSLDGQSGLISQAQISILEQRSPEVQDAWTVCDNLGTHLSDTATTCRSLATACTELAEHIQHAHAAIEHEIKAFLAWTAAIEGAGAALSILSFGIAEGAAQAAEALRVIETGETIAAIIDTLATAARTVTTTIRGLRTTLTALSERLLIITDARLATLTYRITSLGPEFAGEASALVRLDKAAMTEGEIAKAGTGASDATRAAQAADKTLAQKLDDATVWPHGRIPTDGGPPNGIIVKRGPNGEVSNYTIYDNEGRALKRVDLTGSPHGIYPTPHTLEYTRNEIPKDKLLPGQDPIRVGKGPVRPARKDELP